MKPKKGIASKIFLFLILACLSAVFCFFTFKLFKNQIEFLNHSYRSEGTVVSISENRDSDGTTYSPVVEYSAKEGGMLTFTSSLGSGKPSYSIGEKVPILIPNDNGTPQIDSFMELWFGPIMLGFFALLTTAILIFVIYAAIVNKHRRKLLSQRGQVVQAKVLSVSESAYHKNETLSWIVKAQWHDPRTNKVFVFDSEEFNYNPKDFVGETVDVLILPEDPRIYEMNLAKLPVAAN